MRALWLGDRTLAGIAYRIRRADSAQKLAAEDCSPQPTLHLLHPLMHRVPLPRAGGRKHTQTTAAILRDAILLVRFSSASTSSFLPPKPSTISQEMSCKASRAQLCWEMEFLCSRAEMQPFSGPPAQRENEKVLVEIRPQVGSGESVINPSNPPLTLEKYEELMAKFSRNVLLQEQNREAKEGSV